MSIQFWNNVNEPGDRIYTVDTAGVVRAFTVTEVGAPEQTQVLEAVEATVAKKRKRRAERQASNGDVGEFPGAEEFAQ